MNYELIGRLFIDELSDCLNYESLELNNEANSIYLKGSLSYGVEIEVSFKNEALSTIFSNEELTVHYTFIKGNESQLNNLAVNHEKVTLKDLLERAHELPEEELPHFNQLISIITRTSNVFESFANIINNYKP